MAKHGHGKIPVVELIDGNGPDNEGLAAPPLKKERLDRAADGMEDEMRKIDACWQSSRRPEPLRQPRNVASRSPSSGAGGRGSIKTTLNTSRLPACEG